MLAFGDFELQPERRRLLQGGAPAAPASLEESGFPPLPTSLPPLTLPPLALPPLALPPLALPPLADPADGKTTPPLLAAALSDDPASPAPPLFEKPAVSTVMPPLPAGDSCCFGDPLLSALRSSRHPQSNIESKNIRLPKDQERSRHPRGFVKGNMVRSRRASLGRRLWEQWQALSVDFETVACVHSSGAARQGSARTKAMR